MFEYHGWVVVRESPGETDQGNLEALIRRLKDRIALSFGENPAIHNHWINGANHLIFTGDSNRPSPEFDRLVELLQWIGESAPGSYGLMHVWDDESSDNPNGFQTWTLKRGRIFVEPDQFLSPCVPQIED